MRIPFKKNSLWNLHFSYYFWPAFHFAFGWKLDFNSMLLSSTLRWMSMLWTHTKCSKCLFGRHSSRAWDVNVVNVPVPASMYYEHIEMIFCVRQALNILNKIERTTVGYEWNAIGYWQGGEPSCFLWNWPHLMWTVHPTQMENWIKFCESTTFFICGETKWASTANSKTYKCIRSDTDEVNVYIVHATRLLINSIRL